MEIILLFGITYLRTFYWPKDNDEELKNVGVQGNLANNIKSMILDPFKW